MTKWMEWKKKRKAGRRAMDKYFSFWTGSLSSRSTVGPLPSPARAAPRLEGGKSRGEMRNER